MRQHEEFGGLVKNALAGTVVPGSVVWHSPDLMFSVVSQTGRSIRVTGFVRLPRREKSLLEVLIQSPSLSHAYLTQLRAVIVDVAGEWETP